jgi:hypothetical protein
LRLQNTPAYSGNASMTLKKVFKPGLKKFKEIRRELSRKQEKLKKSPQVVHEV